MDVESSKLLCINTHRGFYKYTRLSFRVKVALAIFQQVTDTMLGDLDYTIAYLDDILVTSKTTAEHQNHKINVFEKLKEYGFKVKEAKCDFFLREIKYLGHIINGDGRQPDPKRANAIRNMPVPENFQAQQSFFGLANFYQGFIKNMQNLRGPLNELLKKEKPWLWSPECQESFDKIKKTPECQESFEKIKKTLTSDLSLTHYDPTLDIIVSSDASSYGIGACIFHILPDGLRKAVAHASRSLLPAEKQYSQIEKDTLGIIFPVTNFHRYLHGRRFILQTDHKPLITIFGSKKGLPVYTANGLSRWGTILLNYNFKIVFLTSKNICHADSLSRLISKIRKSLKIPLLQL